MKCHPLDMVQVWLPVSILLQQWGGGHEGVLCGPIVVRHQEEHEALGVGMNDHEL